MAAGPDGALIRRQTAPVEEVTEIRGRFMHVLAPGTGREAAQETLIVPIPREIAPLLDTLRAAIRGDGDVALPGAALSADEGGWRLEAATPQARMRLLGCGDVLTAIELEPATGVRRRIVFEP